MVIVVIRLEKLSASFVIVIVILVVVAIILCIPKQVELTKFVVS